ncbi:MAG: potassium efflux system protein [Phycisphaerae bacterium]|nr:MAG: potassium efflux system protein [Phycisphaerae bacterium]
MHEVFQLAQVAGGSEALDLLVVLATAGAVALGFARLRLPPVPGYLIAGAVIGPSAVGLVSTPQTITGLGQLSTILLMFIVGLQLDMTRVRLGLFSIIWAACLATALTAALAWPVAWCLTGSLPAGLTIAMAMSIAATAVPLRTLEQRRELHSTYGRLAFGITLFQDLLAVGMLALLPVLALWSRAAAPTNEGDGLSVPVGRGALAIAGIIALVLVGRVLLPRLLRAAGKVGGEVLIVVSAAVALGAAVLSSALGFSPELGAFLAGFLLASTPFRHQIAGQLIPMRDLFLAVFFTVVGMSIPLVAFVDGWWVVLVGFVALGVVKVMGIAAASWALGATPRFALLAAVTLAPAGEFTLIMLAQARAAGVLDETQGGYATAVVGLSIIAAPLIVRLGHAARWVDRLPCAPWLQSSALRRGHEDESGSDQPPTFHAIIGGFGPVGRAVADRLERDGARVTVVELNPRTVERQVKVGRRVVYGDISNPGVLESAGLAGAGAVILTAPDDEAMLRACEAVRAMNPTVFLAVRVSVLSIALRARAIGADHAIIEEVVTAEAMADQVVRDVRRRRETPPAATPSVA